LSSIGVGDDQHSACCREADNQETIFFLSMIQVGEDIGEGIGKDSGGLLK